MLSWISDIYKFITGTINDVKNWILRIIQAVYSFIDTEFHALEREIVSSWRELYGFIQQVNAYAIAAYNGLSAVFTQVWHDITSWVVRVATDLRRYLDDAITWFGRQLANVIYTLRRYIDDTITWIQKNVLDPLINSVGNIIAWLQRYGMFMYYLLTHPDALVSLLGRYLWSAWLDLLKRNSKPIASWLLHSMLGVAGVFADVLETIISAML